MVKKKEKEEKKKEVKEVKVIVKEQSRIYDNNNQKNAREWMTKLIEDGIIFIECKRIIKRD